MSEPYQPISCVFHEQLEMAALKRKSVDLYLKDGQTLAGIIEDVWTELGAEYLRLKTAQDRLVLRLDRLERLEGTD